MQVIALLVGGLILLNLKWVLLRIWVVAYARYLPRYLDVGLVGLDAKAVILYLARYPGLRELVAHNGQLVPKVAVEGFKVAGQEHRSVAIGIGGHVAVV